MVLVLIIAHAAGAQIAGKKKDGNGKSKGASGPAVSNPFLFLIRDPGVQADLKLRDDQKTAVRHVLDEIDGPLWLLRDANAEDGGDRLQALIAKAKIALNSTLKPDQWKRIDQIVLQAQGPEALSLPAVAQKLALSADQKKEIREAIESRRKELQELVEQVKKGTEKDGQEKANKIRSAAQEQLLAILTESQRKQWAALQGKPIDLSSFQTSRIKAPEIMAADEWINSEPLLLEGLRGRVVALHFWTFG
jgi:hypothetical protein